jgi:hypothetical protein
MSTLLNKRMAGLLLVSLPLCLGQTCAFFTVDGGDGGDSGPPETPGTIKVRFINSSVNYALDVQFYAVNFVTANVDQDLFQPANRIIGSVGFAATGLIPAGDVDSIELNCDGAMTIGTPGGYFIDEDTGAQVGQSTRWAAQLDLGYQCGDTITLIYKPQGDGFETDAFVE